MFVNVSKKVNIHTVLIDTKFENFVFAVKFLKKFLQLNKNYLTFLAVDRLKYFKQKLEFVLICKV